MFRCPECNHTTKNLRVFGWLVYGEATINRVDTEENLSAIIPHISINADGFKQRTQAECPRCGLRTSLDSFPRISVCFFTGKEGTENLSIFGQNVYVHSSVLDDAQQLANTRLDFPFLEVLQGG